MEIFLDAYAARSCPLQTWQRFAGGTGHATPTFAPIAGVREFVAKTLNDLAALNPESLDLRTKDSGSQQEAATSAAMQLNTPLIIGGVLPRNAHRMAKAPLLVKRGKDYLPVLPKYQRVVEKYQTPTDQEPADYCYSTLAKPNDFHHIPGYHFRWKQRTWLTVQLAHYYRMLQASANSGTPLAGVIGIDELLPDSPVITWIDLSRPQVIDFDTGAEISPLELYDKAFSDRLQLAELAISGQSSQLTPIITKECEYCPWKSNCISQLEADDLSLRISKTPLDRHEVKVLHDAGIQTIGDLAKVDLETFLPKYLPQVAHRAGAEQRIEMAHRRSELMLSGVELQRTSTAPFSVPRAELEIDIDLETSLADRVYLWGFLVNDNATNESYYRGFVEFSHLDDDSEAQLAITALEWLREMVAGKDALIYHYSDYEITRIRRLAGRTKTPELIAAKTLAEERFVDLFKIVRENYFGAHGLGLKSVAVHGAGFHWRDDDPGGLNSMTWFEDAIFGNTPQLRSVAQKRVLEYNEDDVRATLALRNWLEAQSQH